MLRARLFAAVPFALGMAGLALAGCSSASAPSWLQTTPPPPQTQALQFESQPAGADVHTAAGQTCRTPCSLAVPVTNQSVDFALNGYTPQTIQVGVHEPEHSLFSSPPPDLVPNPVRAIFQAAPPPARKIVKPKSQSVAVRPRPATPQQPSIVAPEPRSAPMQDSAFPPPPPVASPSPFPAPPATR